MKKNIIFGFMMVLVLMLIVGCGKNDNSSKGSSDEGKVEFTYWSNFNEGEPMQQVLKTIVEDYEAENENVKINVEWMGRQVMSKVRNAMLSGDGPDLIDKAAPEILGAIGSDTESLNDLVSKKITNEDITIEDSLLNNTLELFKDEDKVFFIPFTVLSSGFFYDKNMFEENNVVPADTWDDFEALTKQFQGNDIIPLSQDGNIGFYNAYYFYWLSARINGPGAFNAAASDETGATWDEPGYLEAAKKIEGLVDNESFQPGYEGSQFPAAQTQWAQGKTAMILNGSWLPHETMEYASDEFEYGVFPFPEVEGGKGNETAEVELIGWAAPEGADVEAVSDFIAFGMQEKYHQQLVDNVNNISSRHDMDAPDNLANLKDYIMESKEIHKLYDGVEADYPKYWTTIFLPTSDKLMFGEITAEEFISSIKEQTIKYWAEN